MGVKDSGVKGYELDSSQLPKKTLLHGVSWPHTCFGLIVIVILISENKFQI
jgi:hypothetical protein